MPPSPLIIIIIIIITSITWLLFDEATDDHLSPNHDQLHAA